MQNRSYQKQKEVVKRFIKKQKTSDTSRILNEVNIDYDTLMLVLADLRKEGYLRNNWCPWLTLNKKRKNEYPTSRATILLPGARNLLILARSCISKFQMGPSNQSHTCKKKIREAYRIWIFDLGLSMKSIRFTNLSLVIGLLMKHPILV